MIIRLAWRNVWRNKVRSMAVILGLSSGLFGAIFYAALGNGMVDNWVSSAIETEIGDIQIHNPDYLVMEELKMTLDKPKTIKTIENQSNIRSYSSRLKVDAMASTANNIQQVSIFGIEPKMEKLVSQISEKIIEGNYFDSLSRSKPIVISQRLADKLKVRLNSKIIFTMADVNGNIAYENFKVNGIFKTNNSMSDLTNVFIRKSDLSRILKIDEDECHQLIIRTTDENLTEATANELKNALPNLKVQSWRDISPTLRVVESTMGLYNYILIGVVLIALVFGIVNTMLMVILERTKEIGMLRSLGMPRRRIASMITFETIFLCLVGAVIGNILSFAGIEWFGVQGLHFEEFAEGFEQYGMSSSIYPTLESIFYLNITGMVVFTAIFSSIFPIIRAFKLNPAEAIRD